MDINFWNVIQNESQASPSHLTNTNPSPSGGSWKGVSNYAQRPSLSQSRKENCRALQQGATELERIGMELIELPESICQFMQLKELNSPNKNQSIDNKGGKYETQ